MQVAVSWLRLSVAGISHRRPGNCFRASYVIFVVDQVALEQVFLAVLRSFLVSTVRTVDHMSSVIYHRPHTFDTSLNPLKTKRRLLFFSRYTGIFLELKRKTTYFGNMGAISTAYLQNTLHTLQLLIL